MECNKEEAVRAKGIAENKMQGKDFTGARKFVLKARQLFPDIENISQMLSVCEVHCSAGIKVNGETDWYAILQVEATADEIVIKKQYRKLALILHPDKNQFPGAEAAFKLVGEAHRTLSDPVKRSTHNIKRGANLKTVKPRQPSYQSKMSSDMTNQTRVPPNADRKPSTQFSELRHPSQPSTAETFWTVCPFCAIRYQYYRSILNKVLRCQTCKKPFIAYEMNVKAVPSEAKLGYSRNRPGIPDEDIRGPGARVAGKKSHCGNAASGMGFEGNANGGATFSQPGSRPGFGTEIGDGYKRKATEEHKMDDDAQTGNGLKFEKVRLQNVDKRKQVKPSAGSSSAKRPRKGGPTCNGDLKDSGVDKEATVDGKDSKCKGGESSPNRLQGDREDKMNNTASSKTDPSVSSLKTSVDPESVTYPDPEFYDFEKERHRSKFAVDQIWAVYDDLDGMPRFYVQIKNIYDQNFHVRFVWLEKDPMGRNETEWYEQDLPVSCGNFKRGKFQITAEVLMFSHVMSWRKGTKRNSYQIYPRKGEVWALFKDWDNGWITDADNHRSYEYELVEVLSEYTESSGISVIKLDKITGFVSLFMRTVDEGPVDIPSDEILRFSHMVPSYRMTGEEREGIPAGSFELDAISLPTNVAECFKSVSIDSCKTGDDNLENVSAGLCFTSTVEEKPTAAPSKTNSSQSNEKKNEKHKSRDPSTNLQNGACKKEANQARQEQHYSASEARKHIEKEAVRTDRFRSVGTDRCDMEVDNLENDTANLFFKSTVVEKPTTGPTKTSSSRSNEKDDVNHKSRDPSCHWQNGACKKETHQASQEQHSVSEVTKHVKTEGIAFEHQVHTEEETLGSREGGAVDDSDSERVSPGLSPNRFYEYPEAEFSNFEEARSSDKFKCGQIWALYSDLSTYPNYYGLITKVDVGKFNVELTWLKARPMRNEEKQWSKEMAVPCGTFQLMDETSLFDTTEPFSHLVKAASAERKDRYTIYPTSGEVWALYKDWSVDWSQSNLKNCEYDVVEILARDDSGIKVLFLRKVHGHRCVFKPGRQGDGFLTGDIPVAEYMKFSHQIPSARLSGESVGPLRGYWELDPASVPEILLAKDSD